MIRPKRRESFTSGRMAPGGFVSQFERVANLAVAKEVKTKLALGMVDANGRGRYLL